VLTALVVFAAFPGPGTEITASLVAAAFFAVSVGNLAKILPLSPAASGSTRARSRSSSSA